MELALDSEVTLPASESIDEESIEAEPRVLPDGVTEQTIQTLECGSGGTVQVTIRRTLTDEPYEREGYLRWTYDECGMWPYGIIGGVATYSREVSGGPPWSRKLFYNANLDYGGTGDGACSAYVQLAQTWGTAEHPLELPTTCPHPVREWWDRLGISG
jgi:hypothetical protein